jgi:hypothetical protein
LSRSRSIVVRMTENIHVNTDTTTTAEPSAQRSLSLWMTMWNTGGAIARDICSADFRIHFGTSEPDGSNPGDRIRGAEEFAAFLDWYRGQHPLTRFTERHQAIDGRHGRMLWDVAVGDRRAGGIDVFDFTDDGLIREVWSVTGTRSVAG